MTDEEFRGGLPFRLVPFMARTEQGILRALVAGEAEGESPLGMEAVAWVVLNRVTAGGWWGTTVRQCALWRHQFSCFWSDFRTRERAMFAALDARGPSRISEAVDAAWVAWHRGHLGADPTHGATYYFNPAVVMPSWASGMRVTRVIGHHRFLVMPEDS